MIKFRLADGTYKNVKPEHLDIFNQQNPDAIRISGEIQQQPSTLSPDISGDIQQQPLMSSPDINAKLFGLKTLMDTELPGVSTGAKLATVAYSAFNSIFGDDDPREEVENKDKEHTIAMFGGDNWFTDFLSDHVRQVKMGWTMGEQVQPSMKIWGSDKDFSNEDILKFYNSAMKAEKIGTTDEVKEYQNAYDKYKEQYGGTMAFFMGWGENPSYMTQVSVQSMSNMMSSLVNSKEQLARVATGGTTAAAGALVLGQLGPQVGLPEEIVTIPTAFIAGSMGTLSATMEVGLTFTELLKEQLREDGKDFTPENIRALLMDDEVIEHKDPRFAALDITGTRKEIIEKRALGRGIAIGTIDGLTAGLTKGTVSSMWKKGVKTSIPTGKLKRKIAATGTGMAITGGLLSEVGGQTFGGQEYEAGEILTEGIAEKAFAMTGVTTVPTLLKKRGTYKINGQSFNETDFDNITSQMSDAGIMMADIDIQNDRTQAGRLFERQNNAILESQVDEVVDSDVDRKELVELEKQRQQAEKEAKLKGIKKKAGVKERLDDINIRIDNILNKYAGIDRRTRDVRGRKERAKEVRLRRRKILMDKITKGVKESKAYKQMDIETSEVSNEQARELFERSTNIDITLLEEELKMLDPKSENYDAVQQFLEQKKKSLKNIDRSIGEVGLSHGFLLEDANSGRLNIVINRDAALTDVGGNVNVAAHEFLHAVLHKTFGVKGKALSAGKSLFQFLNEKDNEALYNSNFIKRLKAYKDFDVDTQAEEVLTLLSDALVKGELTFNENFWTKAGDFIKTAMQAYLPGRFGKIKFKDGRDVYRFVKNYNKSIEKEGKGMEARVIEKAAREGVEVAKGITGVAKKKKVTPMSKPPVDTDFNSTLNNEVEAATNVKDFSSLDKEEQAPIWSGISEQERLVIGMQLGPLWRKWIGDRADSKYQTFESNWNKHRKEFLDKITVGIQPEDNGLPFIVKTWNPKEAKLTTHIINNLERRMPHTARTISGFGEVTADITGAKDITEKPQDAILTSRVLEQYKTPLLSGFTFIKEQIKILRNTVSRIVGTKLKALDAAVSKNRSISPMVADMKKQLYVKNGPIHTVVYDIMSEKAETLTQEYLKKTNPKTKKPYTQNQAKNQAFKDSVEAFFRNNKNKKAVLESLTTTWLAKHLKIGVEKEVNGIGWTTDWIGRTKGTKKGQVNFWRSSEEGPYRGMTDGKPKIRRNPKIMDVVTPAMLGSAFIKGETITDVKRGGLENISLAITQELGLETFKADMINDGALKKLFVNRQELFDRLLNDNFVEEFVRQTERGITKMSLKAKAKKHHGLPLEEEISKAATWQEILQSVDKKFNRLSMLKEKDRANYKNFILEILAPLFPEQFFTRGSTFTGAGASRAYTSNYAFKNKKQELNPFIKSAKKKGVRFGINLTKRQEQDIINAVTRKEYGKKTRDKQRKIISDKEFKASKKRGFKLIWKTIQKAIQDDSNTIPFFANTLASSSRQMEHFIRTGASTSFLNLLDGVNVEEHLMPATALAKYLFGRAVQGNLFDSGTNYFDIAVEEYTQGSLPKIFDSAVLKGIGIDGKKYDYIDMLPLEHAYEIFMGAKSVWARYFHPNVNNNNGGINPNVIELDNGQTVAEFFGVEVDSKLLTPQVIAAQQDLIYRQAIGEKVSPTKIKNTLSSVSKLKMKPQIKAHQKFSKSVNFSRSSKNPTKGITVLDFDDTLATTKSLVRFTTPDGTKGTLNAEQYASQYQDLLEQGYKFDFTEFDKVVKAKLAPLFNKALKLQSKFGPENMFILTARPPAAQKAIYDFLKANGLNIPLKNITALGVSTAEAKALWVADKVSEGYNDFYFADDALQNTQAVQNMLDQFDVKSKVQQAKVKFSKSINTEFNNILEDVTGIESKKRFSAIKARKRGASKGKFRFFIPPSHEDFVGLLYNFMGKGRKGDAHRNFFEKALVRPLNRAYRELNTAKQAIANDYKSLNKEFTNVKKKLTKKTPDGDFTYQDAIRVYLFDKHGHKVPGLTKTDQQKLVDLVMEDTELQTYAETLNVISKQDTYVKPSETWETGDIRVDLDDATGRIGRASYFTEFNENAEIIFSEENLNKIEAAYGTNMVSAIKDILYRTKTGRNRPSGQNKLVNGFMNYLNGSVASTMFFNMRSAVLQQMSMVNFINFADNNVFTAAKAFANQPQYWKDWTTIFNSDFMKQRRGGIKTDVNGAELAASLRGAKNTPRALLAKLLQLGFLPTQIGDNMAIATGGSTFYRNRINTYLKQGLNQKEAESKAWIDFQTLAEATQQSARPDMVSQQQASPLGKVILAFQNVTSQFNRLGKKAFLDIKNRRITPGNTTQFQSDVSNMSRIGYYFAIQNLIFYSLQSALFLALFEDDEDDDKWLKKKERVVNGSVDSVLRGTGVWGAVVATAKNMAIKWHEQREKGYNADESSVLMEMLNVSPPLGIKARKMVNAEKTLNYNKKVIDEMETFDIDNPMWSAVTNYIEATTNIPTNRLYNKTQNVRQSLNNQHEAYQRALMFGGWSQWNLDVENEKMEKIKEKTKKSKKKKKKEFITY